MDVIAQAEATRGSEDPKYFNTTSRTYFGRVKAAENARGQSGGGIAEAAGLRKRRNHPLRSV